MRTLGRTSPLSNRRGGHLYQHAMLITMVSGVMITAQSYIPPNLAGVVVDFCRQVFGDTETPSDPNSSPNTSHTFGTSLANYWHDTGMRIQGNADTSWGPVTSSFVMASDAGDEGGFWGSIPSIFRNLVQGYADSSHLDIERVEYDEETGRFIAILDEQEVEYDPAEWRLLRKISTTEEEEEYLEAQEAQHAAAHDPDPHSIFIFDPETGAFIITEEMLEGLTEVNEEVQSSIAGINATEAAAAASEEVEGLDTTHGTGTVAYLNQISEEVDQATELIGAYSELFEGSNTSEGLEELGAALLAKGAEELEADQEAIETIAEDGYGLLVQLQFNGLWDTVEASQAMLGLDDPYLNLSLPALEAALAHCTNPQACEYLQQRVDAKREASANRRVIVERIEQEANEAGTSVEALVKELGECTSAEECTNIQEQLDIAFEKRQTLVEEGMANGMALLGLWGDAVESLEENGIDLNLNGEAEEDEFVNAFTLSTGTITEYMQTDEVEAALEDLSIGLELLEIFNEADKGSQAVGGAAWLASLHIDANGDGTIDLEERKAFELARTTYVEGADELLDTQVDAYAQGSGVSREGRIGGRDAGALSQSSADGLAQDRAGELLDELVANCTENCSAVYAELEAARGEGSLLTNIPTNYDGSFNVEARKATYTGTSDEAYESLVKLNYVFSYGEMQEAGEDPDAAFGDMMQGVSAEVDAAVAAAMAAAGLTITEDDLIDDPKADQRFTPVIQGIRSSVYNSALDHEERVTEGAIELAGLISDFRSEHGSLVFAENDELAALGDQEDFQHAYEDYSALANRLEAGGLGMQAYSVDLTLGSDGFVQEMERKASLAYSANAQDLALHIGEEARAAGRTGALSLMRADKEQRGGWSNFSFLSASDEELDAFYDDNQPALNKLQRGQFLIGVVTLQAALEDRKEFLQSEEMGGFITWESAQGIRTHAQAFGMQEAVAMQQEDRQTGNANRAGGIEGADLALEELAQLRMQTQGSILFATDRQAQTTQARLSMGEIGSKMRQGDRVLTQYQVGVQDRQADAYRRAHGTDKGHQADMKTIHEGVAALMPNTPITIPLEAGHSAGSDVETDETRAMFKERHQGPSGATQPAGQRQTLCAPGTSSFCDEAVAQADLQRMELEAQFYTETMGSSAGGLLQKQPTHAEKPLTDADRQIQIAEGRLEVGMSGAAQISDLTTQIRGTTETGTLLSLDLNTNASALNILQGDDFKLAHEDFAEGQAVEVAMGLTNGYIQNRDQILAVDKDAFVQQVAQAAEGVGGNVARETRVGLAIADNAFASANQINTAIETEADGTTLFDKSLTQLQGMYADNRDAFNSEDRVRFLYVRQTTDIQSIASLLQDSWGSAALYSEDGTLVGGQAYAVASLVEAAGGDASDLNPAEYSTNTTAAGTVAVDQQYVQEATADLTHGGNQVMRLTNQLAQGAESGAAFSQAVTEAQAATVREEGYTTAGGSLWSVAQDLDAFGELYRDQSKNLTNMGEALSEGTMVVWALSYEKGAQGTVEQLQDEDKASFGASAVSQYLSSNLDSIRTRYEGEGELLANTQAIASTAEVMVGALSQTVLLDQAELNTLVDSSPDNSAIQALAASADEQGQVRVSAMTLYGVEAGLLNPFQSIEQAQAEYGPSSIQISIDTQEAQRQMVNQMVQYVAEYQGTTNAATAAQVQAYRDQLATQGITVPADLSQEDLASAYDQVSILDAGQIATIVGGSGVQTTAAGMPAGIAAGPGAAGPPATP